MRWIGFLGSWALLILALGLAAVAGTRAGFNVSDERHLDRVDQVEQMINERTGNRAENLRVAADRRAAEVSALQARLAGVTREEETIPDTGQTILVSTEENKLYVRRNGQIIFQAVCSTGKGTTLSVDGKTSVFDTPIGEFKIKSKEENPLWVPPDWHFVEEAQKNDMRVVHLNPGDVIDADTGDAAKAKKSGFWSSIFGGGGGSRRVLMLKNNTVVESDNGVEHELPPGTDIIAGNAIIVPPVTTPQRHYDKVLGKYRLELGGGYGIHGTDEPDKLGQSVSHGCVRLGDDDIAQVYQMANVGDSVIIY